MMNGIFDNISERLIPDGAGREIGTQVGCGIASGFEEAVPPFPFTSPVNFGSCPLPGTRSAEISGESVSAEVLGPIIREVQQEAARVSKERIRARLTPYFVGLPLVGITVGLGLGYILFRRK